VDDDARKAEALAEDEIDPEGVCRIREMDAAVQRLNRLGIEQCSLDDMRRALRSFEDKIGKVWFVSRCRLQSLI
jgi:hypothetical protein